MLRNKEKQTGQQIVDQAQKEIDSQFPTEDTINSLMRFQYFRLSIVTSNFTELQGKKILDIGCGAKAASTAPQEERRKGMYEPWFARFAAVCGADVIGIDRRKSEGENFVHLQADIAKPETLQQFSDTSFDIVNSSAFLVPKKRQAADSLGINVTAPELLSRLSDEELELLDDAITKQVMRILKEGGYFFYNERIYQKRGDELRAAPNLAILVAEHGFPVMPQRA